jgi:fumarylacetoacetate (FAA) hydrolase family protein
MPAFLPHRTPAVTTALPPLATPLQQLLPADAEQAVLIGRAWLPEVGPAPVLVRSDAVFDLSRIAPTCSELLEREGLVDELRAGSSEGRLPRLGDTAALLANSLAEPHDPTRPWLLAPCDLQAVKASGVTFVASLLERVIEEQARGDAGRAQAVREALQGVLGDSLSNVVPGSDQAAKVKQVLVAQGAWSQYLEVGIGPDAEIFTKAQPMSAVGLGAEVGLHPGSSWNNPEPEIVLAVTSRGATVGASLGNDVNLRDFEGRSALLLGKAKDNNASCAIGPFIRLFDAHFGIADVRRCELAMSVDGPEGFHLDGHSSLAKISRDPLDLVGQAIGPNHQYPDGMMLFLGTMFAPVQDRFGPGQGFTHALGDVVRVATPLLGTLVNRVTRSDRAEPWSFGTAALMRNLARRGLL